MCNVFMWYQTAPVDTTGVATDLLSSVFPLVKAAGGSVSMGISRDSSYPPFGR
jgi:hypothetical protein